MKIIKALLKPRPLIGIGAFVLAVYLASLQHVPLWWSIPAGLLYADTFGFIYDFIQKERINS